MTALALVLLVAAFAMVIIGSSAASSKNIQSRSLAWLRPASVLPLAGSVLLFLTTFVVVVPAGHRGVVTWFGSVEERVLGEGLAVVVPVAEQVILVDVRVQPHPFKEIEAATKEYQMVRLTGMMNFHVQPDKANALYQQVGLDFANRVIDPAFNDYMKEVMPGYSINEVLPLRDKIRAQAMEKLGANLSRYHITIDDIYISNISFSTEYTKIIEEKQVAQQQVEKEKQVLEQRKVQAEQKVAEAKGEADSRVTRAKGEAEANRQLVISLTPELIQYLYSTKWDGKLPQVTSGGIPLLDMSLPVNQPKQ